MTTPGSWCSTEPDLAPGADAAPVLHLRDEVLDIAVTPDRGYCLSLRGVAREAAQLSGWHSPIRWTGPVPAETVNGHPVELQSEACPLFVALTVTGIDPGRPTPRWLARRVQLAGMRSISLAVDITNYVMLETGQPIHAYDADRLDGPIVVRKAAEGEKLTTLDDVVRPLHPDDLVDHRRLRTHRPGRCDGRSHHRALRATRNVVIEAAHFDAMTIARTSRRHKLSSEASRRFERGVDPEASYAAAHRVAELLVGPCRWHAARRGDGTRRRAPAAEHHHRGHAAGADSRHRRRSRHRSCGCCRRSARPSPTVAAP